MCGIMGLILGNTKSAAAPELFEAGILLQHRGQDAAGIATSDKSGRSYLHKGDGLIAELKGSIGLGHLRYPTTGPRQSSKAQPFTGQYPVETYLVHNGNIVNTVELQKHLGTNAPCPGGSDSELLLCLFIEELKREHITYGSSIDMHTISNALAKIYELTEGSFACVMMISGVALLGFRDSHGIKPLVYGERQNADGSIDYMLASESVALNKLDFRNICDIEPGEAVIFPITGVHKPLLKRVSPALSYTPDIFEYVYFARPESVIDGISVHRSRQKMGVGIAKAIKSEFGDSLDEIDVVMAVPETSNTCALAAAQHLNKTYSHGLVKNRYIFRTFITPGQSQRRTNVWRKITAVQEEFENRNVLIIDDSIVRGTTSKEIVEIARNAGAKKVIFASCSPPIRHNHIYGINLSKKENLIAFAKTTAEICQELGCDRLVYLPLERLIQSCLEARNTSRKVNSFEIGVFTGDEINPSLKGEAHFVDRASQCHTERSSDREEEAGVFILFRIPGLRHTNHDLQLCFVW
ncbi:phosphoribosyltransferase-like protein [Halenospora varia]|nr:phosphoribosyltransferase-like protein [Halenospora varia]